MDKAENLDAVGRDRRLVGASASDAVHRSSVERPYHKLIYFNELDKGEHYGAWEQPKLFSEEVRAAFKLLRM